VSVPGERDGLSEARDDVQMTTTFGPVVPILRMYDLRRTLEFYVDYLGCTLDWQDGDGEDPTYLQVSRGHLVLHLSSHHDDGTPGTAILIETQNVGEFHAELHATSYRHMLPGIEIHPRGREVTVIDPASNRLRFFERTG
jgi:ribosomal-protein-alanine N-acetyltransferase